MTERLNTSPFAIYSFKVKNTGMIPITFKYGKEISIDTMLQFAPTIGGLMSVVYPLMVDKGILNADVTHTAFSIITKINYVYFYGENKYVQTLYAYKTHLTENERHSGNIYEIDNTYHIDSSLLPNDPDKRERGYFVLNIDWEEKTGNFEGMISSFVLPITEVGAKANGR